MDGMSRIDLLLDTDAVSGTLEPDGRHQSFTGWLELTTLVEDLRRRAVMPPPAPDGELEGRR